MLYPLILGWLELISLSSHQPPIYQAALLQTVLFHPIMEENYNACVWLLIEFPSPVLQSPLWGTLPSYPVCPLDTEDSIPLPPESGISPILPPTEILSKDQCLTCLKGSSLKHNPPARMIHIHFIMQSPVTPPGLLTSASIPDYSWLCLCDTSRPTEVFFFPKNKRAVSLQRWIQTLIPRHFPCFLPSKFSNPWSWVFADSTWHKNRPAALWGLVIRVRIRTRRSNWKSSSNWSHYARPFRKKKQLNLRTVELEDPPDANWLTSCLLHRQTSWVA